MNLRRVALWLLIVVTAFVPVRGNAQRGKVVPPGAQTRGSVVVLKGNLDVYGTVRGNATAVRGDVVVHRGGRVTGDATAVRGKVRLLGGSVDGKVRSHWRDAGVRREQVGRRSHSPFRSLGMALGWTLIVTVAGFGLLAFGSDKLSIVINTMQSGIGKSLASGLLGQLAIIPGAVGVVILLAATLVGILLIPLGLVAFIFFVAGVAMIGFVAVATMTGAALTGGQNRDETPHGAMLRAFFTGTLIYAGLWVAAALLGGIPLIGPMARSFASAVTFVAVTTGFGAVLLSYWRGEFKSA